MSFERAIDFVLKQEGGAVDHPSDRGGATKFGISSRAHPDVDLSTLTREGAIELYRTRYWLPIQGDALPQALGLVLLDHAVHAGIPAAVRALQRRLGFDAHETDGVMGPKTLAAALSCPTRSLIRFLLRDRAKQLVHQGTNASQQVFLGGWVNRLLDLALEAARA